MDLVPRDPIPELVAAARAGDKEAFGRLTLALRGYLLAVADAELAAAVRPKATPADVVQDTFLEGFRLFHRFTGDQVDELRAWLRAILRHKVQDAHARYLTAGKRRADREQSLDQPFGPAADGQTLRDTVADTGPTPSGQVRQAEQAKAITDALDRLPDPHRQVVIWRNWDGLSFADIGAKLARTEDAARMLFVRALERLQRELDRGPAPPPGRPSL